MGAYTDAVITGLVILLICSGIIFFLILRHLKDQRRWEQIAQENYILGKDEASELLRETCDKIEEDRELLAGRSEKELLTEIMLTLGSFGRRIDRLDDKLHCLAHYQTHIEDMNGKTQRLTQSFILLERDIAATSSVIGGLRHAIEETGDQIDALIGELSGMGRLHQEISSYASQLNSIELTLEYLQEKTAFIVEEMNTVMTTHDQSPAKRLKTVEMEITGLSLLVNALHDTVTELSAASERIGKQLENDSIRTSLETISDTLGTVRREMTLLRTNMQHTPEEESL